MYFNPFAHLGPDSGLVGLVIIASHEEDLEVWRPSQTRDLVSPLPRGGARGGARSV